MVAPSRAASATPSAASGGSLRRPRLRPAAEAAVIEWRARTRVPMGAGSLAAARALSCRSAPRSPGPMTYVPDETDSSGAPATGERAGSRRALGCAFEIVETLVLTLLIYLVIHNFVAQPFEVQQSSMVPTIVDGEYILIDKLTPRVRRLPLRRRDRLQPAVGLGPGVRRDPVHQAHHRHAGRHGQPRERARLRHAPGREPGADRGALRRDRGGRLDRPDELPARRLPAEVDRGRGRVLRDGRQPPVEPGLARLRADRRGPHPRPGLAALLPARADRAHRAPGVPAARRRARTEPQARAGSSATIQASTSRS